MNARPSIIDSHHHLWDLSNFPYEWLKPESPPRPFGDHTALKRNYSLADYRADMSAFDLRASVHVGAHPGLGSANGEIAWLQALQQSEGLPVAAVAQTSLGTPGFKFQIDELADYSVLRGVRSVVIWSDNPKWQMAGGPGLTSNPEYRRDAALLADRQYSLDLLIAPGQFGEVAELAAALPALRIIVNHLGTPFFSDTRMKDDWYAGIELIADSRNVFMKISGLWPIERNWDEDALREPVLKTVRMLGPERCLWGSNLPVENLMCPAEKQLAILGRILTGLDAPSRNRIFSGTAAEVYRLENMETGTWSRRD